MAEVGPLKIKPTEGTPAVENLRKSNNCLLTTTETKTDKPETRMPRHTAKTAETRKTSSCAQSNLLKMTTCKIRPTQVASTAVLQTGVDSTEEHQLKSSLTK